MKLKTLKDLEYTYEIKICKHEEVFIPIVKVEKLKQEAIKWYKDIEASQPYEELSGPEAAQMWIRVFFGLDKEDLK